VRVEQSQDRLRCSDCGSAEVWSQGGVYCTFRTLPIGSKAVLLQFKAPRVLCFECTHVRQVKLGFADPRRSCTRAFERYALELSQQRGHPYVAVVLDLVSGAVVLVGDSKGVEVREQLPRKIGQIAKYDSDYERHGTANVFLAVESFAGKRTVRVTGRRTRVDWAQFVRLLLLKMYPEVAKASLVMDNLNTHGIASLYEAFDPETARSLAARLEIRNSP